MMGRACFVVLAATFSGAVLVTGSVSSRPAAPVPVAGDSGAIRIHLLGHAIGSEQYVVRSENGVSTLTDTFALTDRGGRLQLASTFRYESAFEPLHLRSV